MKMAEQRNGLLLLAWATCFLLACIFAGTNCDVPDGVVYTDLHKTARKGDDLTLKCQFYGAPFAVYWKKGENPFNSPDLIKWVEGESPSGSCVRDYSCSMDDDYSLIIKDIGIANQGTHICLVSNYLGILIHNFTEVTVYAPPMEPFPAIKECPLKLPNDTEHKCRLSTSDRVTITCCASGYFPDIDLFFLQGSQRLGTATTEEATNPDGTKNKSISAVAEPSEIPYVCVAFNVPGSRDQRTVSIEVNFLEFIVNTTVHSQTTVPGRGVAKVVVPVLIVIVLLLIVLCVAVLWRRRRKQRRSKIDDPEAMPLYADPKTAGKISFYELWYLVQNMDATDLQKLKDALSDLGITVNEVLTTNNAYELLCEWKDTNTYDDERMRLRNTLFSSGLGDQWKRMTELKKYEGGVAISEEGLDYIVKHLGNERAIDRFLRELISDEQENELTSTGNRDDIVEEAVKEIMKWRARINNRNHFVLLSLALERAECRPLDRTFFQVLSPVENRHISLSFKRSILRSILGGLLKPHDVIYQKGQYFITDAGHQRVSSYDPATGIHRTVCWVIPSNLYGLASLSDTDKGILVTNNLGGHVYRIDNEGVHEWASGLNKPTGITTHKGEVFVAEYDNNDIRVYDNKGNYLRNFDSKSDLKQPSFLAVNSKDRLYVADSEAIKVFTTDGEYIESFKISNDGNWLHKGIAIDRYDNVFVTAYDGRVHNETIAVFNSEHRFLKKNTADSHLWKYLQGLCINDDRNELVVVWARLKLFELYES